MANNNPQRERILARLRAATSADVQKLKAAGQSQPAATAQIFPAITDPRERFLSECNANLTEVVMTEPALKVSLRSNAYCRPSRRENCFSRMRTSSETGLTG